MRNGAEAAPAPTGLPAGRGDAGKPGGEVGTPARVRYAPGFSQSLPPRPSTESTVPYSRPVLHPAPQPSAERQVDLTPALSAGSVC